MNRRIFPSRAAKNNPGHACREDRKKKSANQLRWEADPELTRHYGEQCRELHIMLMDDDIENVFPSSYAWWTATERKCWGDGTTATGTGVICETWALEAAVIPVPPRRDGNDRRFERDPSPRWSADKPLCLRPAHVCRRSSPSVSMGEA
jgi:hypothetical protein